MSKAKATAGMTGMILGIFVPDTSSTIGAGLAITHASPGLIFEYRRAGQSSWTSVTPVAGTLGTYTSGGIVADGGATGFYEIGIPNAALAVGARRVYVRLRGVANMAVVPIEIELDRIDYQDQQRAGLLGIPTGLPGATDGVALVGSAMTLTPGERTEVANEVERQIIDESDPEKVLEAFVNKINAMTDLDALSLAAIANACSAKTAADIIAGLNSWSTAADELARRTWAFDNYGEAEDSAGEKLALLINPDNATITAINTIVTALQNRVGAITGSGNNTILGMLRAIASKSAATPSDIGGTFSAATDSLEAQADNVLAVGVGPRSVIATVRRSDTNAPIEGATVRITDGIIAYQDDTDVNGQVSFSMVDKTWKVYIVADGFTFGEATLVVDGNETPEYFMTPSIIAEPEDPGLCNVLFAVKDAGEPVQGAKVYVELEEKNPTVNGWLVARSVHSGTTDSNGFCTLTMIQNGEFTRGGVYVITVYDATGSRVLHKRRAKVPNQSTCNAEDLIDA
jgi:hypothetical protein